MFPYGVDFNDEIGPVNDDASSGRINILTFFPFYDELHESLFVNTNGIISFDEQEETFTSKPFPLTDDDTSLIAPFWADVDTRRGGTIYYREMTRRDDEDLADAIDDIINQFVKYSGKEFQLIWYLVATWDQVAYYGRLNDSRITNTFQAILVTDGLHSYTVFNYGDIQWTTGTASGGDNFGLGGTPAQVGCNAGDEVRHHNVAESQTDAIVNIDETSNVGQPGRYFFKISEENVVSPDCNAFDSGSILTYPSFGSMLGGARIFIQGTCFENQDNVTCKFIDAETGTEVPCQYEDERTVSCVVPWLLRIGRVHVFLSKDGGMKYGFKGIYTSVSVDEVTEDVAPKAHLEYDDNLESGRTF
ncbi:sushi, nidogen and EGF-like domain-containing protein 1 [Antedon mediterranea]|uniref:sushi, nidogen and EGF-like domain-containing protein 1 n=1 Tax=Antedon mediterranea TaxID=105859 RepID=UPI003AF9D846